jgi:virulence-associated protein VagC
VGQRATAAKAQVIRNGRSQSVRLPAGVRFTSDEVYIRRDETSGVVTLSEKPLKPTAEEIFRAFDEAGAQDFVVERDHSSPREMDL